MKIFLLLVLSLFFIQYLSAQKKSDKTEMESERQQIQQELQQIEQSYNAVKGLTKENLSQLAMLNRKVELQEKYINNISKEIRLIDDDIYYSALEIRQLKKQLDTLKTQYAHTVVYAYKNRSNYDYLNFIFSANSFNDAVKRVAYLKSYRNYRQRQMGDILKTRDLITKRYEQQVASKNQKETAFAVRSGEYNVLESQKKEKDSAVIQLRSQAGDLQKQIARKKQRDRELRSSIAAVVRKEIAEARKIAQEEVRHNAETERKARAEALARERAIAEQQERERLLAAAKAKEVITPAKPQSNTAVSPPAAAPRNFEKTDVQSSVKARNVPGRTNAPIAANNTKIVTVKDPIAHATEPVAENKPPPGGYLNIQASDVALNGSFEQNKGRLPNPVDNGFISLGFGRYKIEGVGPSIVGDNPGITFSAATGSPVKAVFDGEVASIANIGGMSFVVLRHGKYFTAYSNLASVNVSKGAKVSRGQNIGSVGADEETGNGKLDFILMIEERNVDPRNWLRR